MGLWLSRGSDILPRGTCLGAGGGLLALGWPTVRCLQGEEQRVPGEDLLFFFFPFAGKMG